MDQTDLPARRRLPAQSRLEKVKGKLDGIRDYKIGLAMIPDLTRTGIRKNPEVRERKLHRKRLIILDIVKYTVTIRPEEQLLDDPSGQNNKTPEFFQTLHAIEPGLAKSLSTLVTRLDTDGDDPNLIDG